MNVWDAFLITGLFALCVLLAWINLSNDKHEDDRKAVTTWTGKYFSC